MARVLVVDDKESNRELLRTMLEHAGHEVTEAGDGVAALESMRLEKPEVVLLDIQMPSLDGYAVLERVLADTSTVAPTWLSPLSFKSFLMMCSWASKTFESKAFIKSLT